MRDVRMIERRKEARLTLEARAPAGVVAERRRQDFDRDVAAKRRVASAIDLAHAARTDVPLDLVDAKHAARERRASFQKAVAVLVAQERLHITAQRRVRAARLFQKR